MEVEIAERAAVASQVSASMAKRSEGLGPHSSPEMKKACTPPTSPFARAIIEASPRRRRRRKRDRVGEGKGCLCRRKASHPKIQNANVMSRRCSPGLGERGNHLPSLSWNIDSVSKAGINEIDRRVL